MHILIYNQAIQYVILYLNTLNIDYKAIPLPYIPSYDSTIAIIVLSCFLISCFLFAKSKKFLLDLGSNFFSSADHVSAFSTKTNSEISSLLLLMLQTCIMIGVITLILAISFNPDIIHSYNSATIIGGTTVISIVYLLLKRVAYIFIGWVFNARSLTSIWLESYATIIYYSGFVLYPIVLYVIFSTTPINISIYIAIMFVIIVKSLMLYKWLKLFSKNIYGSILLFLYFCALEITPCMLIYKSMINNIDVLTINI